VLLHDELLARLADSQQISGIYSSIRNSQTLCDALAQDAPKRADSLEVQRLDSLYDLLTA
jgi:hypothetical protein